jgi:hypothetical protein
LRRDKFTFTLKIFWQKKDTIMTFNSGSFLGRNKLILTNLSPSSRERGPFGLDTKYFFSRRKLWIKLSSSTPL